MKEGSTNILVGKMMPRLVVVVYVKAELERRILNSVGSGKDETVRNVGSGRDGDGYGCYMRICELNYRYYKPSPWGTIPSPPGNSFL